MKQITILCFVLFSLIAGAYAQTPAKIQTAEEKADEVVAKLKTDIALTDEQAPKVKTITVDRINKVTAAYKKSGADKQRLAAANKLIMDDWETQLKGIVTEDQFKKYLASKGQR